jgi:hypothetical protein
MIESQIYSLLNVSAVTSIVSTRIYPTDPKENTDWPFLVYKLSRDETNNTLTAVSSLNSYTLTVDLWTKSLSSQNTLSAAVQGQLSGYRGGNIQGAFFKAEQSEQLGSEEEGDIYHDVLTFSIWASSANIQASPGATGSVTTGTNSVTLSACSKSLTLDCSGLKLNGSNVIVGPGGANGNVQFNNSGAFGGDANLTISAGALNSTYNILTTGYIQSESFAQAPEGSFQTLLTDDIQNIGFGNPLSIEVDNAGLLMGGPRFSSGSIQIFTGDMDVSPSGDISIFTGGCDDSSTGSINISTSPTFGDGVTGCGDTGSIFITSGKSLCGISGGVTIQTSPDGGGAGFQVQGRTTLYPWDNSTPILRLTGASGQTGDYLECLNSVGSALAWIDSSGNVKGSGIAAVNALGNSTVFASGSTGAFQCNSATITATASIQSNAAGNVALTVKGAASQSANLQNWTSSTPATLASISSAGDLTLSHASPQLIFGNGTSDTPVIKWTAQGSVAGLQFKSNTTVVAQMFDNGQLQCSGNLVMGANASLFSVNPGAGGIKISCSPDQKITNGTTNVALFTNNVTTGTSLFTTDRTDGKTVVVRCISSQTGNLQEWQDATPTTLAAITKNGGFQPAHMADSSAANDTVYYSTTASKLVYKDSGGVVNNLY